MPDWPLRSLVLDCLESENDLELDLYFGLASARAMGEMTSREILGVGVG